MRTVYVPGIERRVPLRAYVRAVRLAKANPDTVFRCTLCGWWPGTGRDILRQFMDGVHQRINDAVPYVQRGAG